MEKHRLLVMDLLSNLVAFLVLFNIFSLLLALNNGRLNLAYLLLALPFALTLFLRKKIKKMRYFLAIHFSMLALPFVVWQDLWTFVLLLGFVIAMILYSIRRKSEGEWNMQGLTAVWMIALLAALSMVYAAYLPDISGISILLNISSLISLASVVLYVYLDNMQFSLDLIGASHKGNSTHISSVGNGLITVFLIIIVTFGALSLLFPSEAAVLIIAQLLFDIVGSFFRFVSSILQSIGGEEAMLEEVPMEWALPGAGLVPEFEEISEGDPISAILAAVARFLTTLGLIAIVTAFLGTLFYRLYRAFNKKERAGKQSLMPEDAISKLKFVLDDFKELLPRLKLSTKHPVRRAYIKKVNGHIKQGLELRPHYTPEVIADKIRPKEDIDELTQKYEKVRYGRT